MHAKFRNIVSLDLLIPSHSNTICPSENIVEMTILHSSAGVEKGTLTMNRRSLSIVCFCNSTMRLLLLFSSFFAVHLGDCCRGFPSWFNCPPSSPPFPAMPPMSTFPPIPTIPPIDFSSNSCRLYGIGCRDPLTPFPRGFPFARTTNDVLSNNRMSGDFRSNKFATSNNNIQVSNANFATVNTVTRKSNNDVSNTNVHVTSNNSIKSSWKNNMQVQNSNFVSANHHVVSRNQAKTQNSVEFNTSNTTHITEIT